jgi:hypothetical protein
MSDDLMVAELSDEAVGANGLGELDERLDELTKMRAVVKRLAELSPQSQRWVLAQLQHMLGD